MCNIVKRFQNKSHTEFYLIQKCSHIVVKLRKCSFLSNAASQLTNNTSVFQNVFILLNYNMWSFLCMSMNVLAPHLNQHFKIRLMQLQI